MKYKSEIQLITRWVPQILQEWLSGSLPVDLTLRAGKWRGMRVLVVTIEADSAESLEAKRRAFNAMIEAKGYGPKEK
ncbi:MAG: hypothetical protein NC044_08650 [Prevotella sp.]|nr:hypothetical protein [Bacteroides sp.]MCM1446458.1 hypothetical protein [Prevotella sp.]